MWSTIDWATISSSSTISTLAILGSWLRRRRPIRSRSSGSASRRRSRARCTISARTEGDAVLLSVADNGSGVPDEELPRLFERFFRGDPARTTHGTGLGLAIVKHIVTQAGGEVEARRGPGGLGLEVRCLFPR